MTTYLIIKLILFGIGALGWGIYCGINGLDLSGQPEQSGPRD